MAACTETVTLTATGGIEGGQLGTTELTGTGEDIGEAMADIFDQAEAWVEDGEWGTGGVEVSYTVDVHGIETATHTVWIEAVEPECTSPAGHDWQDAGVHGVTGGRVACDDLCAHCGIIWRTIAGTSSYICG